MKTLNKLRLAAGIPIDPRIEITEKKEQITEARAVPGRRAELAQKTEKNLGKEIKGLQSAIKHIEQAIAALEKVPATGFGGDIPHFIAELEDVLSVDGGQSGMKHFLAMCETKYREFVRGSVAKRRAEEEEEAALDMAEMNEAFEDEEIDESVHRYTDGYEDFEDDESKPVNVADGSANDEQVWDEPMDPKNVKDESPTQLRTGDEKSEQDQSDGHDLEAAFKVPPSVKASLKAEIADIKKEVDRLDVYNKETATFYRDMQRAFEDLLGHLEKGTRYDFKMAQHYAQSLMGPMLHKLPADVWKFISNGGQTRSLKDYMKKVPDPITGPRNSLK